MKALMIIALMVLAGCRAHIEVVTTDPETGVTDRVTVKSARRTAISTKGVTVITGQVLINDETVQALGKTAATVVDGK